MVGQARRGGGEGAAPPGAEDALPRLWELAEAGRLFTAFEEARAFGPLASWTWSGAAAAVASRIAAHAGAERLAKKLAALGLRRDPESGWVLSMYGHQLLHQRGPYAAWAFCRDVASKADLAAVDRAEIVGLRVLSAAGLRDFEAGHAGIEEIQAFAPTYPDLAMLQAAVLEAKDRYPEALQAAMASLATAPGQRHLTQRCAHLLQLEGRAEEARRLLEQADARFECAAVAVQLAAIRVDLELYEEAEHSLDRYVRLSPLLEPRMKARVALLRADCAYRRGDFERARAELEGSDDPFFRAFAGRLAHPEGHRRKKLHVPFVRQHDRTCSPATLAALSRFWGRDMEHLEIASAICYDGTPNHLERDFADKRGWIARELRVTWDAAVALVDRGVPFMLSTYGVTGGHAQAVIGYDVLRGSLLLRDPFVYGDIEVVAETFLESQAPTGPRGMVLVPAEEASRLSGIDLPDAPLYDLLHRMQQLLAAHDRSGAMGAFEQLSTEAPGHRLVHAARRAIAVYDEHTTQILACAEERLRLFPNALSAAVEAVLAMRSTATSAARIERLSDLVRRSPDPVFLELLAGELAEDDRRHDEARRLSRRALFRGQVRAESHATLASLCWSRGEHDEALELYRFAACLHDRDEGHTVRYALAARAKGRIEEVLRFVRARAARHGKSSRAPILTLAQVLDMLDRTAEASAALDEAIATAPDDGELALAAAPFFAAIGRVERARELLERARGRSPERAFCHAAATLAAYDGTPEVELAAWRAVLDREPVNVAAHARVAELIEGLYGRAEARKHLAGAREAFPHSQPLGRLWIAWLTSDDPGSREAELLRHLEVEPDDAWALRELALHLSAQRRFDEALRRCDEARDRAPHEVSEPLVRGQIEMVRGETARAREAFRRALEIDPDAETAIHGLLVLAHTREERDEEVTSLAGMLAVRSVAGQGIPVWYDRARPLADPSRLAELTAELRRARPELTAAWIADVRQLVAVGRIDEARAAALEATARFPLAPGVWAELAHVEALRGDAAGELAALEKAHETSPLDGVAARALALCHERHGRLVEARAVLGRVAARSARDPSATLLLASMEWSNGEREAALDRVRRLLRGSPGNFDALLLFASWSAENGDPEGGIRLARQNAEASPESSGLRVVLAQILLASGCVDEAGAALDEALARDPFSVFARELKSYSLAASGRFDDAIEVCTGSGEGGPVPAELLGRAAWAKYASGDRAAGIQAMRDAVGRHPSFAWGLRKLAEWHEAIHDHAAQAEFCRDLVKISPRDGDAHAALAIARLRNGDREGAERSFERALTLGCEDAGAARQLCEILLDAGDRDGAERALRLLRRVDPPAADGMEIEIAVHEGDEERAAASFGRLCLSPSAPDEEVRAARRRLVLGGLGERAQRELSRLHEDAGVHPIAAEMWAQTSIQRRDGALESKVRGLDPTHAASRRAAVAAVHLLARHRRRLRLLRLAFGMRVVWRSHPELWSGVAEALLTSGQRGTAAVWLAGCPVDATRSGAALLVVSLVLQRIGKPWRAAALSRRVAEGPEVSPEASYHGAWAAIDAALDGDDASAAAFLDRIDEGHLVERQARVVQLARRVLDLRAAPRSERARVFAEIEPELSEICLLLRRTGHAGASVVRRAERRIALDVRSMRALSWALGTNQGAVLGILGMLAVVGLIRPPLGAALAGLLVFIMMLPWLWERSWPPSFGGLGRLRGGAARLPAGSEGEEAA